jgi:RimJ/RimL family protein N-acetyltransferase
VVLRPAGDADVPALEALAAHPDVEPTLSIRSKAALAPADHQEVLVIECPPGMPVGAVRAFERHPVSRIVTVQGLMVDPAVRGRGIAVAAVRALVDRVLGEQGRHRLEAEVYGFNEGGLRTFDGAGFEREGYRRRAYWRHGAWQDTVLFARTSEDDAPPPEPAQVAR